MPIIDVKPVQFLEIAKKGYTLDIIFLLKMAEEQSDMSVFGDNPKISNIGQTIVRKGLCTNEGKLTEEGKQLLAFLSSTEETPKIVKTKTKEEPFVLWWSTYPSSDTFDYKGRKFNGTRALKAKKKECKVKIDKILSSGEYTIEELVEALKLEIHQKAENSFKTGQNKMSYFSNSLSYLNGGVYDVYVELVRKGHKVKEETKNTSGGVEI